MPTIAEQSQIFLKQLQTRKREKAKPSTINTYTSYINTWIVPEMGQLDLSQVGNGSLRRLVSVLSENNLAPASIQGILQCVKSVVKSCINDEGEFVYRTNWNNAFIDAPPVSAREQESPVLTSQGVSDAISQAPSHIQPLLVLLAATGVRVSEGIAIRKGSGPDSSFWDPNKAFVSIQTQLYDGYEISPKTQAGFREVDLCESGNYYLIDSLKNRPEGEYLFVDKDEDPWTLSKLYKALKNTGIPGFHSFRRFRTTHLRSCRIPEDIIQFWIGHSNKTITDRYSKMAEDVEGRKKYAAEAGLGFELPAKD